MSYSEPLIQTLDAVIFGGTTANSCCKTGGARNNCTNGDYRNNQCNAGSGTENAPCDPGMY